MPKDPLDVGQCDAGLEQVGGAAVPELVNADVGDPGVRGDASLSSCTQLSSASKRSWT